MRGWPARLKNTRTTIDVELYTNHAGKKPAEKSQKRAKACQGGPAGDSRARVNQSPLNSPSRTRSRRGRITIILNFFSRHAIGRLRTRCVAETGGAAI